MLKKANGFAPSFIQKLKPFYFPNASHVEALFWVNIMWRLWKRKKKGVQNVKNKKRETTGDRQKKEEEKKKKEEETAPALLRRLLLLCFFFFFSLQIRNLWNEEEDDEERDEIILALVIYGFGLCWVCIVFEEIYGMRRKMTKREMGNYFGFGLDLCSYVLFWFV